MVTQEIIRATPTEITIMEALARFRYLTVDHLLRLEVSQSKTPSLSNLAITQGPEKPSHRIFRLRRTAWRWPSAHRLFSHEKRGGGPGRYGDVTPAYPVSKPCHTVQQRLRTPHGLHRHPCGVKSVAQSS